MRDRDQCPCWRVMALADSAARIFEAAKRNGVLNDVAVDRWLSERAKTCTPCPRSTALHSAAEKVGP